MVLSMFEDKWEPKYGNASRPKLLSDGSQRDYEMPETTQKEDFRWPRHSQGPCAKRKELMEKNLFNEIKETYSRKKTGIDEKRTMEKFTSYTGEFRGYGFDVRDILESADPEKMAKYPLYSDQGHSIYFDNIKKIKEKSVSNDPQACFRKCSYFSKPFYAELED